MAEKGETWKQGHAFLIHKFGFHPGKWENFLLVKIFQELKAWRYKVPTYLREPEERERLGIACAWKPQGTDCCMMEWDWGVWTAGSRAAIPSVNHLLCVAKDLGYPAAAVPAQSGLRDQVLGAFESEALQASWRMCVCDRGAHTF